MRLVGARLGGLVQRRGFASTAGRLDHYAFVGLGQMVSLDAVPSNFPGPETELACESC